MPSIEPGLLISWKSPDSKEPVQYHASYSDPLAQQPWVFGFMGADLVLLRDALARAGTTLEQAAALAEPLIPKAEVS